MSAVLYYKQGLLESLKNMIAENGKWQSKNGNSESQKMYYQGKIDAYQVIVDILETDIEIKKY